MNKRIVITTIRPIGKALENFLDILKDYEIIVIGDKKSQTIENQKSLRYYSVEKQLDLNFEITQHIPFNHYCRKNIGYLIAIKEGVDILYDTDDDNFPYAHWSFPSFKGKMQTASGNGFINTYQLFSSERIWPRGYPLELINKPIQNEVSESDVDIAVWQGLVDLDPDVDAIYRLLEAKKDIKFELIKPIALSKNLYCPFNSQNTLWQASMLAYAYLPMTVTFRFTDILRGYIAQRCFWAHGKVLGFCAPSVYQDRNSHNLLSDFESEIPCYLRIAELVDLLNSLSLNEDYAHNLTKIYGSLYQNNFVQKDEIVAVQAWLNDLHKIYNQIL